jgi:hypothetical protein
MKANWEAAPTVIVKELLVAGVMAPSLAVRVYPDPVILTLQPEKLTTPEDSVPRQPIKLPGPPEVGVPVEMVRLTVDESDVTTLPPASSTVTCGWVAKVVPAVVVALGDVVKTSWEPGPTETAMALLVAEVRDPSLAVRVYPVPALSMEQAAYAATPNAAEN